MTPSLFPRSGASNQARAVQTEIEAGIGEQLAWEELQGRRACRVRLARPGQVKDVSQRDDLIGWLLVQHLAFRRVFRPIVGSLPDELWSPAPAIVLADAPEDK
jgi:hypothetical protein